MPRFQPIHPGLRASVAARLAAGESPTRLAEETGLGRTTVDRIRQELLGEREPPGDPAGGYRRCACGALVRGTCLACRLEGAP